MSRAVNDYVDYVDDDEDDDDVFSHLMVYLNVKIRVVINCVVINEYIRYGVCLERVSNVSQRLSSGI